MSNLPNSISVLLAVAFGVLGFSFLAMWSEETWLTFA
jgi:hypothetical protein